MKRFHWRRTSIVRPAGLLAVVAVVLAAACGTGSPQPEAATTTSPTTTRPTTPSAAAVQVVPARVLRTAIATTGLGTAYKVMDEMHGDAEAGELPTGMPGGFDLSSAGDFVSGPAACAAMFKPHSQAIASAALVFMETKTQSATLFVQAESYETPEQAKKVMAENHEQAKGCTTFKMRMHAEPQDIATVTFGAISGLVGDNEGESFSTNFEARTPSLGASYAYHIETYELRIGGEILHVTSGPGDINAIQALGEHFEKVITTYRNAHPRPGDD